MDGSWWRVLTKRGPLEKGMAKTLIAGGEGYEEDEMVGWRHQWNGHEFEQALGVGDGKREAWHAAVHGVAKSRTRLSN